MKKENEMRLEIEREKREEMGERVKR